MTSVTDGLIARLQEGADPATKAWWERYLKNTIRFRGVRMADIRWAVHDWFQGEVADRVPAAERRALAAALIRRELAEDKLAGILLMQEVLLPAGELTCDHLGELAALFDDGAIADWNTCDWFCVRILGPLAERDGMRCARSIAEWREAPNLWRRRASLVAFVKLAPRGDDNFPGFVSLLLGTARAVVRDGERFAQTAVGWSLRELSKAAPGAVIAFCEANLEHFSREAIRMVTAKLSDGERTRLLDQHRQLGR